MFRTPSQAIVSRAALEEVKPSTRVSRQPDETHRSNGPPSVLNEKARVAENMADKFAWDKINRNKAAKRGPRKGDHKKERAPAGTPLIKSVVLHFGKYYGWRIDKVPPQYLQWALKSGVISSTSDAGRTAKEILGMTKKRKARSNLSKEKKPEAKINFGKFKGKPISEVPKNYLAWALKKGYLKGFVREQANILLGNPVSQGKFPSAGPFGPKVERGVDCPFDCPEDDDERDFVNFVRGM